MNTEPNPRELRVSDAEREHVVGVLQKAIGHGMLTLDEFTERTDTALAARTRAELNAVLVDLPGIRHNAPESPVRQPPVELRANMSTLKRTGRWTVPQEMIIRNRLGSTDLDFTEAECDHAEVRIVLEVGGGSVKLTLPDRAGVDTNAVRVTAGTIKDKVGAGGAGARPRFIITGSVTAGSLKIRRASYVRIGNLMFHSSLRISRAVD